MAMAGGLLLLLLPLALPAQATTNSDYTGSGVNDGCTAFDLDGIYSAAPSGDASSCDGDSEDTSVVSTYNGGVLTSCTNAWTPTADASQCQGGFIFNADDATAGGNFGGDFPIAETVIITADDPSTLNLATGLRIRTTYLYYETDTVNSPPAYVAGQTLTTGLGTVCVADKDLAAAPAGTVLSVDVNVGGADPWDPPAGPITILQVVGFRDPVGGAPCAMPASAGPRVIAGDWDYEVEVDDMSVAAAITSPPTDNGDGTCSFAWSASASTGTRYGIATIDLSIDGGLVFGYFDQSTAGTGAAVSADETTTGIDTILYGEWVTVAAAAWGVGGEYAQTQDPAPPAGPMTQTYVCTPGVPSDLNGFVEPYCVATGVWDGSTNTWAVGPAGLCLSGDLTSVPPVATPCSTAGNVVTCAPLGATCNGFGNTDIAVATGGNTQTVMACGGATVNDADTAAIGLPVALVGPTPSTTGAWSCTATFSPVAGASSVHTSVCLNG